MLDWVKIPLQVSNNIDYVTIAQTGNAVDFGDLTVGRGRFSGCSSPTRGVFLGGTTPIQHSKLITLIIVTIPTLEMLLILEI